ncbi:MAG: UbiA family prenyltransferase [Patescibacteria group bacterium]|nr:UbiA family prenyltransferase [Patescibacteria group bacterium]
MLKKIKEIIEKIENSKTPFHYFVLSFFFVTFLRTFLEYFSDIDVLHTKEGVPYAGGSLIDLSVLVHYVVSYVTLATLIILICHVSTKVNVLKISKVVLSGFIILISVPITDLIVSGGAGSNIAYIFIRDYQHLFSQYIVFGIDSLGIRIEIAIVLLGAFTYFRLKGVGSIKSFIFTFLLHTTLFICGIFPFLVEKFFNLIEVEYLYTPTLMTNLFLSSLFLAGIPLLYFANKKYFKIILKDIRPFRIFYFELMFFLGIILVPKTFSFILTADNLFSFIFIPISIVFAGLFSIITNNIEDYEIDKISNKERPLVKKEIDPVLYMKLGWLFLIVALIYSFASSFLAFFIITLWIGNYFLYSMPPFRLKRIPFFSKLIIAFNSLILIILGFVSVVGCSVSDIPKLSILVFLIVFTAVINFIDIKDYEGDKKEGIKTLPVLLGLKRSKILISIFFAVAYLFVVFLTKELITLILFFFLGCLQVYLINRRDYKEKYVFIIVLSSILYIIFEFLFS